MLCLNLHLSLGILKISYLLSSLTLCSFSSMLFYFQEFTDFLAHFDLLISSFTLWWSEKMYGMISFFLSCGGVFCDLSSYGWSWKRVHLHLKKKMCVQCLWNGSICIYVLSQFVLLSVWDRLLLCWLCFFVVEFLSHWSAGWC